MFNLRQICSVTTSLKDLYEGSCSNTSVSSILSLFAESPRSIEEEMVPMISELCFTLFSYCTFDKDSDVSYLVSKLSIHSRFDYLVDLIKKDGITISLMLDIAEEMKESSRDELCDCLRVITVLIRDSANIDESFKNVSFMIARYIEKILFYEPQKEHSISLSQSCSF